jgi:hypothetical protein
MRFENLHYLSLQKAVSLNESLVYSYLYVNKLTLHPEVQHLGIDKKISKLIENLDLDERTEFTEAKEQYQPDQRPELVHALDTHTRGIQNLEGETGPRTAEGNHSGPIAMSRALNIAHLHPGAIAFDTNAVELRHAPRGKGRQVARQYKEGYAGSIAIPRTIEWEGVCPLGPPALGGGWRPSAVLLVGRRSHVIAGQPAITRLRPASRETCKC